MEKSDIEKRVEYLLDYHDCMKMFTPDGFTKLFFERLSDMRNGGIRISKEKLFEILNEKYEKIIGVPRYASYDSFRRRIKSYDK